MYTNTQDTILQLVRMGIGHEKVTDITVKVDWVELKALAERQGLSAIVLDGIEKLADVQKPPKDVLLEWIGEMLGNYEQRYKSYRKAIGCLAEWHNERGFKMMVLKGYACSIDWPKPNHRPCGDIDIWQFGKQKEADKALKLFGVKVDTSHHHHTVFEWHGYMVENHYDFINVHDYKSSRQLEAVFKQLGRVDKFTTIIDGQKVYIPSPNLHALFLLRHNVSHFTSTYITLRQVLDWGFFVEKHTKEIDWIMADNIVKEYGLKDFFDCLNGICVGNLGFEANIFPIVQFKPDLKDKVLEDVLSPEFEIESPEALLPRLLYKYKRWKANEWKRKMCYQESALSALLSNIWAHVLKPASV